MLSRSFLATVAILFSVTLSSVARAETKFGYVDLQRALAETEEGRAAKSRLQGILESKQKEIDRDQDALRKEKEMLDKQASAMSEETKMQKSGELQKKFMDLAQRYEKGKQEMQVKERTELQGIFAKMDPIIKQIAEREGFTMVFEKTDSGIVYAPAHLDLTNELVRMYNDQNKGKGSSKGKGGAGASGSDAPKKDSDAPKK